MKTSQIAELISRRTTGMRSNQNVSISANRNAGTKLGIPRMPVEWLDSGSWRLPSGKALAEFALQAGFLAPLLFRAKTFGKPSAESGALEGASEARGKHFGKGGSH
jgi:hypothetical protein